MQRTIKYDVLSSELNDAKELRLKLGDSQDESGGVYADCAVWGAGGVIHRPADPDGDGACMAVVAQDGNDTRVVALKDQRLAERYGELAEGDTAVISYGEGRILVKAESDSVSLVTKNQADESTMTAQLSGESGAFKVLIGGPKGATYLDMTDEKIVLGVSGGAQLVLSKTGATITAPGIKLQGPTAVGVMPGNAPIPPTNGVAYTTAGPVNVVSSQLVVAP